MYRTSVLKLIKSEPLARLALAIPAMGTLVGSALMATAGVFPCLLMDAAGLLCGLLILLGLVLKYLWIEHLLIDGEEIEGKVLDLKDNPGISISHIVISHSTNIEYQYSYEGVEYNKRITVHLPEEEHLKTATILFDPDRPESSTIKELYCVPSR